MTLEEAKKEIDRMTEEKWQVYEKTCQTTTLGEAYGLEEAMRVLDQVDGEPVENPDTLTLTELAHELRKTLCFRWLTLDKSGYITLWKKRPKYEPYEYERNDEVWHISNYDNPLYGECGVIFPKTIKAKMNLEEYKNKRGGINYSKCIVEVE